MARLSHQWAVVHAGGRDRYQVAAAIHEAGALRHLVTDFYAPDWLLPPLERSFPTRASSFQARHDPKVPSRFVSSSLVQALGARALRWSNIDPIRSNSALESLLSRRAARYARAHPGTGILCYSYYWESLGDARSSPAWDGPGVVFQVHPIAEQVRGILANDRAKTSLTYGMEREEVEPPSKARRYRRTIREADGVFAASSFTARGLREQGVLPERVAIVPYGADTKTLPRGHRSYDEVRWTSPPKPLRLLWVGQLAYRKGPHHLFRALQRFPAGSVELTLVTRSPVPAELRALAPPSIRIFRSVSDATREKMYATHHLLVMPSLVEGFGLAYLEALSNGLPILCTPNSGAVDIISDEVEGFIVDVGDADSIGNRIEQCLTDFALLAAMSEAARRATATWTWGRFRAELVQGLARFEAAFDARQ